MRPFILVLPLLLLASGASAETAPPPPLCDPARIGARELADCQRSASEKSEHELGAALAGALKAIDSMPKMLAARKARWKRFLNDSQTQWASWRDEECQDLAPLEAAAAAGDPRLSCIIQRNTLRAADLKARYP